MGLCISKQPKQPKQLIRLIKIKMDICNKSKDIDQAILIWNKIIKVIQQIKTTSIIPNDLQEDAKQINTFIKSHRNQKFLDTFFYYYDQFQYKLNEQINQQQELWIQFESIFSNLDSLNNQFSELGYVSQLGRTQSFTKYN